MKDILTRMNELAGEMVQKNAALTLELTEGRKNGEKLKEALKENKALLASLKKREKAVKGIEDIVALKKEAEAMKVAANVREKALETENQNLISALVEREEQVDKGKREILAQQDGIDRQKKKLEEDKKNYKATVLKAVQKDLDKASKKV